MSGTLTHKRAFVTGGSRGIGVAIVERLACEAGFVTGASLAIDGDFTA